MTPGYAERIVCLTEETTETLYALGEERRIVGISGFTVRPPRARKEKPRVSAFTSARFDRILALEPDLVLGFSDLQSEIGAELVRHGIAVHIFNQRSVGEILAMIRMLGGMVGCEAKARRYADDLERRIEGIREKTAQEPLRPRVYFEEWDDPNITGIRWVSELVEIAGGEEIFPERAREPLAKNRIIPDAAEIAARRPDIIIGSWCGKKFRPERVASRPGWHRVPAVVDGELHEVKSSLILQPGPAALTDGLDQLRRIVGDWRRRKPESGGATLSAGERRSGP